MAYTPELSSQYSGILRRIAWAYGIPMTEAIEGILELAGNYMDGKKICEACRDKSFCEFCLFREENKETGGEI